MKSQKTTLNFININYTGTVSYKKCEKKW